MARRRKWWHTLQEARRQACVAIDFYNQPGNKRSLADFVVHMHLGWQNMLHADFERRGVIIYFREKDKRTYKRDANGQKVSWDLATCLKKEYKDSDPIRANVEFFIGLRNAIEHRYQDSLLLATSPHAHALVLNFEQELVTRFDKEASLAEELRFPVFVQTLTPEGIDEQRELRRQLKGNARTYITGFEARLSPEVRKDNRFEYRVMLTPLKGPKSEADLAFTFVNTNTLTKQQLSELRKGRTSGTVLIAEKQKSVGLKDERLPKAATAAIELRIPFAFNLSQFTRLRQKHGVGPGRGVRKDSGDGKNCIYIVPTKQHVYTSSYVDRCVEELETAAKYLEALGVEPKVRKHPPTKP